MRHVWNGEVLYAMPTTVVQDSESRSLLYVRAGTRMKWTLVDFDAGRLDPPRDHRWAVTDVLQIIEPGRAHSVWAMWATGGGRFLCWYVNLQAPARRVADGIVTWDQTLDIVVAPDLKWHWKDEDQFARIQELGWMSPEEAASVRAEGESVIQAIERRAAPFDEPWPEWRPEHDWPLPALAANWATVPPEGEEPDPRRSRGDSDHDRRGPRA